MGDGGTYFLVVCDNVSSNVLNALQLAKDYKQIYHNRQSWPNQIESALRKLH